MLFPNSLMRESLQFLHQSDDDSPLLKTSLQVIRTYKPGDEVKCRDMIKEGVMSSMHAAFFGNLFKEFTFQLMILFAAIMFIFFGLPFTICFSVIPVVISLIYIGTYIGYSAKAMEVDQEISKINRVYMSNAFSCFWVAEAFQPHLMTRSPEDVHYTIMTEKQFHEAKIDVSSQAKKIVGTVALVKSRNMEKGAWIKRLCVRKNYRRKGIASHLLSVVVQFAVEQAYNSANIVASEYNEGGRELCFKRGFELKQMYHKPLMGSLMTILMFELTYLIRANNSTSYETYERNLRD